MQARPSPSSPSMLHAAYGARALNEPPAFMAGSYATPVASAATNSADRLVLISQTHRELTK